VKKLIEIDSLDKSIIELLFKDCRISYRTIAKDFAISVGTVHNRIQKLIKNGIIKKFETKFDFFKIGYSINAFIKLNNNNNELIDFIKNKFINNSFENQSLSLPAVSSEKWLNLELGEKVKAADLELPPKSLLILKKAS